MHRTIRVQAVYHILSNAKKAGFKTANSKISLNVEDPHVPLFTLGKYGDAL